MDFFNYIIEKRILLIISLIVNGLLISVCGYLGWNLFNKECPNNTETIIVENTEEKVLEKYYVDIKGEVKNPGVYEVNNTSIINDVIKLAGGFKKNAYTKNINLSKKVSNELVIYIYSNTEYKKITEKDKNTEKEVVKEIIVEECICPEYDITECITNGKSEIIVNDNEKEEEKDNLDDSSNKDVIENTNSTNTNAEEIIENTNPSNSNVEENIENKNTLININTATLEELMSLNGIGESKAKAIIDYRNKNKFDSIEDIKKVSGIGDSAFEKIKDYITVK